jgi:hypothetical protein
MLSPPLVVMSAPLPPTTPVLIDINATTLRVKWYPPEHGCFKFLIHMRQVILQGNGNNSSSSSRRAAAPIIGVDTKTDGWFIVYNGPENIFTVTTLSSETSYELRVFAVNYQGTLSLPSPSITFTTAVRNDTSGQLTAKNAAEYFVVECTGDICVGDTILITERLFLRPKSGTDATDRLDVNGMGPVSDGSKVLGGGSKVLPNKKKPPTSAVGAGGANRLNMSVTSLVDNDGATITAAAGACIGERTIAAFVSKDNFRSTRDILQQKKISPRDQREFGALRKLWLEVVWQKCSTEAARKYELKVGDVLERMQGHLEQFEVFRVQWKQEALRLPLIQEYSSLKDCYIPMDC